MYKIRLLLLTVLLTLRINGVFAQDFRPKFHFSPKAHWMNDPNGMVYLNGIYHLFYQYYPNGTTWGPMHWGHATSSDLYYWKEKPIALYPDSLGLIFSGSAVVDSNNTAGFGKGALVAIFTHHNMDIERAKTGLHQYQSIAFSNDGGDTWTKYTGNPVLPNPGVTDFRDPKVMWYEKDKKWIMTLATKDRVTFYSSADLKAWKKESDFGSNLGAHGGVWECPDLFPLEVNGENKWVLLVSINPGGPNGGSATQYFTGSFDGKTFLADSKAEKWIDYGTDNYAGVTWSNTGKRKIFIGWMNNWQYANLVPTKEWRGAMTLARELHLEKIDQNYYLRSVPVKSIDSHSKPIYSIKALSLKKQLDLSAYIRNSTGNLKIELVFDTNSDIEFVLGNKKGESILLGYDSKKKAYYIDRTRSGQVDFEKGFAAKHSAPRIAKTATAKINLIFDASSVELFADNGLSVMTDIFFPNTPLNALSILGNQKIKDLKISAIQ